MCDRKGIRENENKPGRSRKRSFHGNRHTSDADSSLTESSWLTPRNDDAYEEAEGVIYGAGIADCV